MKKFLVAAIAVVLISLGSCSSGGTFSAGTWSYKGNSYSAYSAIGSTTAKTLTATYGNMGEVDNVICKFAAYPPAPGTYTIVNTLTTPGPSEVYVVMNLGTKGFTIETSGAATATVTVYSDGKIGVNIAAATFSNITGQAADSGPFTAAFTQNL